MYANYRGINMAATARRIVVETFGLNAYSQVPQRSLGGSYCQYRPLYSVNQNKRLDNYLKQQARGAITSSGTFAPVTASSRQPKSHELSGNLNVYESSDHLPSLPVPEFQGVMQKLRESISPVAMNSAELVQTLDLIDEFSQSAGPKLELLLRSKAESNKNWLTHDWWTKEIYLNSRKPLVINSNPAILYPEFPFEVTNQRSLINVVSQLISGIIDFKQALIQGYNPEAASPSEECQLDRNICYHQYRHLFGTTRVPGEQSDYLSLGGTIDLEGAHEKPFKIVISFQGRFFELHLNEIEDEKERINGIASVVDKIIGTQFDSDSRSQGVGVLTATNRDDWANTYKLLEGESMDAIREAQFIVCIDQIPDQNADEFSLPLLTDTKGSARYLAALGRQVLHGDSSNIGNRWFDKALQLIVVTDQNAERLLGAGLNYEHCVAEGCVIAKLLEYSYDKTVERHRDSAKENFFTKQQLDSQRNGVAVFRELQMRSSANIEAQLSRAKQEFLAHINQFDMSHFLYRKYGGNSIKSWRFSPDSWFQIALQMAYVNLHKRLGACYETASTRRFAYGRTETIRSLTTDVANFCSSPSYKNLEIAIQSHKNYANSANNGQAIDRALLGYRMAFNELRNGTWSWGIPSQMIGAGQQKGDAERSIELEKLFSESELNTIISIFSNELIKRSSKFSLSTSQVSSIHPNIFMSYGPILADGYACCYNITGQQIVAAIAANSSNQSFSCEVHELNESLHNSLDSMRDIVEEHKSSRGNIL